MYNSSIIPLSKKVILFIRKIKKKKKKERAMMQTMTISISFRNHRFTSGESSFSRKKKQVENPQNMMMTSITPTRSHLRSMILFYFVCVGYKLID